MAQKTLESPSVNGGDMLALSMNRLTIKTASNTPLPDSPQLHSPSPRTLASRIGTPNGSVPPRSPLHRSPSSMSQYSRSSTPTLLRKASMNSIQGIGGTQSRRSSAHFTNASTMVGKTPLVEEDVRPLPPKHTAASIAANYFAAELKKHHGDGKPLRNADTIVILHDACYGHRYSRPRTSKASLSTIVERPERLQACILGLSVAYVRLGERHAEGRYPPNPKRDPAAIPTTPFRIRTTTRRIAISSPAVTNVHGTKWMEELKIMCDQAEIKLTTNGKELVRPEMNRGSDPEVPAQLHEGDLYLCSESLNAMEGALGAVCEGVDTVFQGATSGKGPYRTFVAIRPPGHHCSASYPSGFCWLNNIHVGISHAALTHGLTHAAIIDFDLHHGDGSQTIAWESNRRAASAPKNAVPWKKTSIGYFSLHDINSYPCEMGDEEKVKNASLCIENAHGQSIWNVHLQTWKSEAEFWNLYETKYCVLLEKMRNYLHAQTARLRLNPNGLKPKGAIFISAGFDASEWESSGMQRHKVNVPTEFYARLTRDVIRLAAEEETAVDGRVISVLEGGYSDRALCTGVLSHISGMASSDPIMVHEEAGLNDRVFDANQKIDAYNGKKDITRNAPLTPGAPTYNPEWWSLPSLEQLDAVIQSPPSPPPEPRKKRDVTPTFSSPTQSFIAKVTNPQSPRRGMPGSNYGTPKPRAPSPPPPEVEWTVAAHELSKLLIPTERQTTSCKPEELSAEATRARRDRQSIVTPPNLPGNTEVTGQRMALRARKPAKPLVDPHDEEAKKPSVRRKTVAGAVTASTKAVSRSTTPIPEPCYAQPTAQSHRRLSSISVIGGIRSEASHSNRGSSSGTTKSQRPGTAQGVRSEVSMSARGHAIPPVATKKTKASAPPRADVAKPSRARRKSPLSTPGNEEPTQEILTSNQDAHPRNSRASNPTDLVSVDDLTSNMNKITLTLTTKAQREAREYQQKLTKQVAATSISTIKLAKAAVKMETPNLPLCGSHDICAQFPSVEGFPPEKQQQEQQTQPPCASAIPHSASSPVSPFTQPPPPVTSDIFIPYQPDGHISTTVPEEPKHSQGQVLTWLPPQTTAPPRLIAHTELPAFTSPDSIPFTHDTNVDTRMITHAGTIADAGVTPPMPSPDCFPLSESTVDSQSFQAISEYIRSQ